VSSAGRDDHDDPSDDDGPRVAIIGMAGRFPGAPDVAAFWRNVRDGTESIRHFSRDELLAAGESADHLDDPGYVPAAPFLDDVEAFDAGFFGWSPREAAITDPQHRIFLETAWHALEDAGCDPARFPGSVGVFASCGMPSYLMHHLVTNRDLMDNVGEWLLRHTGNDASFLATRASYEFNLRGPSMNVQTACSSSLVAVHLAAQSLLGGECDLALAGASTVVLPQDRGYLFKEGEILSPDGHCRPFDAESRGTLFGSGVGCVVLRRLDDALAAGDRVLAVLRGSAINNDGTQKVGFLAPSVDGQTEVIAETLAIAGLDAGTISYVEAHGTGTAIGDPIEVKALAQAFAGSAARRAGCALGSVKANVGHLGEAAGMAALIKMVMALQARVIPPTINFARANPEIDLVHGPFYVPTEARPWAAERRIAGITALGAGGTNAHVIIEEGPASPAVEKPGGPTRPWRLLPLSAKSEAALQTATTNLATTLRQSGGDGPGIVDLGDVAYTLAEGRQAFSHRRILVARDAADAANALENAPARLLTRIRPKQTPTVALMFPGGGAQYAGMGQALYHSEPDYRRIIDEAAALARPKLGFDLRTLLFPPPDEQAAASKRLEAPSAALPALFATEYALASLLLARGIEPAALIGHSMGEYVAACLAGVVTFADGLGMVTRRGQLFETLAPGSMLGVPLPEAEVRATIEGTPVTRGLSIAAVNGPSLCVASGASEAITALETNLGARGVDCTRIHIAVPAHSAMLAPILPAFEAFCRSIALRPPQRRYISNLTGQWITAGEAVDPRYWVNHLRQPVRFAEGLSTLLRDGGGGGGGATVLIEVGPGRTLASLARQQGITPAAEAIPTLPHPTEPEPADAFLLTALGRLWLAGGELKWPAFFVGERRRKVALPGYPFQRGRHWIPRSAAADTTVAADHQARGPLAKLADLGDWFSRPTWRSQPLPAALPASAAAIEPSWLLFADDRGVGAALAKKLTARAESVVIVQAGAAFAETADGDFTIAPGSRADSDRLWQALRRRGTPPRAIVHLFTVGETTAAESYDSLLWLIQSLAGEEAPTALAVVSSRLHDIAGETTPAAEKALLLGPCLVAPRELPHLRTRSVDLPPAFAADIDGGIAGPWQRDAAIDRLLAELDDLRRTERDAERVVAHRGTQRFVRTFERARLEPPSAALPTAIRRGGTYLVTGGLGGVGLETAAWLARAAAGKLVLVGRSPVSASVAQRLQELQRTPGVQILAVQADVRDAAAVRAVVVKARTRFGRIDGVFHAAGTIDDGLLQLKEQGADEDAVIATKIRGAQALHAALADDPPALLVLFSSVSSFMGFEGQIDYAAANAFLDAYAVERNATTAGYTVAVNFSAWRDIGMAAQLSGLGDGTHAAVGDHRPGGPWLPDVIEDSDARLILAGTFQRDHQWVLREHVVRDGDHAVMPGTGFVELARAAAARAAKTPGAGPTVLCDLVFVAPFVAAGEARRLTVTVDRRDGALTIASRSAAAEPEQTHVVGRVDVVAGGGDGNRSAATLGSLDLAAVRARCGDQQPVQDGCLVQDFMRFGPRWANIVRIAIGPGEALLDLRLADDFAGDLDDVALHPALLDMATGAAQSLIPGFDGHRDFYVPFSYGEVTVHRPLGARVHSHVRFKPTGAGASPDTAAFDVAIVDAAGAPLVMITDFVMKRFVMKRVAAKTGGFAGARAATSATHPSQGAAGLREVALREGMTPPEGIEALIRVLAARPGAQVVVSSLDLARWQAAIAAQASADTGGAAAGDAAATDAVSDRPALASAYVEPSDDWQRLVAGVWQPILGIGRIGIHDNFFELGGHSLLLTQAATRVRKAAALDLPLSTLFSKLTIAELAADLKRASEAAAAPTKTAKTAPLRALSRDAYRAKRSAVEGATAARPADGTATPPAEKKPEAS
jgi:acyl transferase domain-containing protein